VENDTKPELGHKEPSGSERFTPAEHWDGRGEEEAAEEDQLEVVPAEIQEICQSNEDALEDEDFHVDAYNQL